MKYTVLIIAFLGFLVCDAHGQLVYNNADVSVNNDDQRRRSSREREKPEYNRWVFGGGLGAGFGTNTFVNVSPRVGYRATESITIGSGIEWFYQSFGNGAETSFRSFGPTLWAQFLPTQDIFLSLDYVYASQRVRQFGNNFDDTDNILWLGGGYIQRTGGAGALLIGAQYNLINDNDGLFTQDRFRPQISFLYGI